MQKEEILEKSRRENKNQDPYEKQVITAGGNAGAIAAAILATVFFAAPPAVIRTLPQEARSASSSPP